jgi:hypothetical protein
MFIIGAGLIAYSYLGAFITLASEIERELYGPTPLSSIAKILHYISSGEIPQLAGYLYGGVFIIVIAGLYLFGLLGNKSENDE